LRCRHFFIVDNEEVFSRPRPPSSRSKQKTPRLSPSKNAKQQQQQLLAPARASSPASTPEESSANTNNSDDAEVGDGGGGGPSAPPSEGEGRRRYRRREDWSLGPALDLSPDDALRMQMEALRANDRPYRDHGVEVLYRFADIDPFEVGRGSSYGGRRQDLGQFERFRRLFHAPGHAPLLGHGGYEVVGALGWLPSGGEEGPARALRRVRVVPGPLVAAPAASAAAAAAEGGSGTPFPRPSIVKPAHFDWLLVQRVGGRADGVWFTASLTRSEFEQRGESEGEGEGKEEE